MRVTHFCEAFSDLTETFIYDSITELCRQGIDSNVVTFRRENKADRPFEPVRVVDPDAARHPLRLLCKLGIGLGLWRHETHEWPVLRRRLHTALKAVGTDVVHAHFGPMACLVAPVARRLRIPLVVTFYGHDISRLTRDPYWVALYRELWASAAWVTVLSEQMRATVRSLGCPGSKIAVVRLGRHISPVPSRVRQPGVYRFFSVGRLTEKKGHDDAITAVSRLVGEGRDVHLRIIGDGPLMGELRRRVEEAGLGDRVALDGARPSAEVLELMAAADAFLLCSRTASDGDCEGTPTVLIEAQMLGLPCVSTTHSGIPEVVPEANHGFLAPEGDVEGIVARMKRVMDSTEGELEEIVGRGCEHVAQGYNIVREADKLQGLYRRASPRVLRRLTWREMFERVQAFAGYWPEVVAPTPVPAGDGPRRWEFFSIPRMKVCVRADPHALELLFTQINRRNTRRTRAFWFALYWATRSPVFRWLVVRRNLVFDVVDSAAFPGVDWGQIDVLFSEWQFVGVFSRQRGEVAHVLSSPKYLRHLENEVAARRDLAGLGSIPEMKVAEVSSHGGWVESLVGESYGQIHDGPVFDRAQDFMLKAYGSTAADEPWGGYLGRVRRRAEELFEGVGTNLEARQLIGDLVGAAESLLGTGRSGEPVRLGRCHGDFSAGQVIQDGEHFFLLDWSESELCWVVHDLAYTALWFRGWGWGDFARGRFPEDLDTLAEGLRAVWSAVPGILLPLVTLAEVGVKQAVDYNEERGTFRTWRGFARSVLEWVAEDPARAGASAEGEAHGSPRACLTE